LSIPGYDKDPGMPVFQLARKKVFPPPELAERDGLLAVGGDLSRDRLLLAYSMGIFPWYSEDSPILWWSTDPRLVLFPGEVKVSRSLRQTIRKRTYEVTFDTAFSEVIRNCAAVRRREKGTWITDEMREAYCGLHDAGFAHSVESWSKGELAGGLYGVALGRVFFGESMFTLKKDASKVAFERLVRRLIDKDFLLIDCQMTTQHLLSLGAREIPRSLFMGILKQALEKPLPPGRWSSSD
jgi:leucyl/phenylalanyl-tRNA--protein transferase